LSKTQASSILAIRGQRSYRILARDNDGITHMWITTPLAEKNESTCSAALASPFQTPDLVSLLCFWSLLLQTLATWNFGC